jgi:hypothetical protein
VPCHDIRHGAQKKLAYRVRERLVRVIKAKKNAKLELKIPFTTRKDPFIGRGGLDRPEPILKLSRVRSLTMGLESALVLPAFQNDKPTTVCALRRMPHYLIVGFFRPGVRSMSTLAAGL